VQRISRCIRTDKNNKYKTGNIFIWCDEYDEILETLSGIKEYDIKFMEKIKVNKNNMFGSKGDCIEIDNDIKKVNDFIIGIKEFKFVSWDNKLEMVKKYIDENHKPPHDKDPNINIRKLRAWIRYQMQNYLNKKITKKYMCEKISNFLANYNKYFLNNVETWYLQLNKLKEYIDIHKKRPSKHDKDKTIRSIGEWCTDQNKYFKKGLKCMKNETIKNEWIKLLSDTKYNKYISSNVDKWFILIEDVKKYIDQNNKKPSLNIDNEKYVIFLSRWLTEQKKNYNNKSGLMKNQDIYQAYTEIINDDKYKKYLE
jgi:hypothetical protein